MSGRHRPTPDHLPAVLAIVFALALIVAFPWSWVIA